MESLTRDDILHDVLRGVRLREPVFLPRLPELYVSFRGVVVNVANETSRLIANPDVSSLRMTYCGTVKIIVMDQDGKPTGKGATENSEPCSHPRLRQSLIEYGQREPHHINRVQERESK